MLGVLVLSSQYASVNKLPDWCLAAAVLLCSRASWPVLMSLDAIRVDFMWQRWNWIMKINKASISNSAIVRVYKSFFLAKVDISQLHKCPSKWTCSLLYIIKKHACLLLKYYFGTLSHLHTSASCCTEDRINSLFNQWKLYQLCYI